MDIRLLIDGADVMPISGAMFERRDPFTGKVATRAPAATVADVEAAVNAAAAAFPAWAETGPNQRRTLLLKAAEVMARESMTWPSMWNGGKLGGIVDRLGVRAWPTIYVLDPEGVIRYKNVRGESLDEAVDRLVAEAEARRK